MCLWNSSAYFRAGYENSFHYNPLFSHASYFFFFFENPLLSKKFPFCIFAKRWSSPPPPIFLKLRGRIFRMFLSHGRVEKKCIFPVGKEKDAYFRNSRKKGDMKLKAGTCTFGLETSVVNSHHREWLWFNKGRDYSDFWQLIRPRSRFQTLLVFRILFKVVSLQLPIWRGRSWSPVVSCPSELIIVQQHIEIHSKISLNGEELEERLCQTLSAFPKMRVFSVLAQARKSKWTRIQGVHLWLV